ncbi:isochorismatase family protein [Heyndrickxia ginsengihumi]|uniref:Isochorismatase n=1 Tax=Heyndrickxia ginsengihumi TaxID=363870 RepID=A0A0A6VA19_9BACI|nr:isochorismatase family protein [Heyndrickxia ginsengihumi]KHD85060.1 isochorismatase [Heyndrickxia ginsengihumi]MBE6184456.1 isochorismatase family protein [Bacillus sp. (in: firmicutes)]NEY21037.1 isochorismatase family protein [Heyndrickxia ginsengihumi]
MNSLNLDFNKTALVLIDLQKGIVASPGGEEVVENAVKLIDVFRKNNGFISFVRVAFHDGKDALSPILDQAPAKFERPSDWAVLDSRLGVQENDYIVTKRQWGAFFGTDLDLQLRRRGIDTIVLCGIATNIGVESTAREAFQYGYQQIFITDAMTTFSKEEHDATIRYIFPRIGRIRTTEEFVNQVQQ